ncbi:hypothetical protein GOV08_04640 [Candidatus Woesearchaeota archaeon]|nr:hypothetical protein [Candidatus Woesearchaeota archaeon]
MPKDHSIIYEDFDENNLEEDKPSKIKKRIIIFLSVFMIILMVSLSLPLSRLGSRAVSEKIESNYKIELKGGYEIYFEEETYKVIRQRFGLGTDEFKICLKGRVQEKTYFIFDYYFPEVAHSSFTNVVSKICDKDTLLSLHSHPSMFCIFSKADIASYEKLDNPDAFIGLICDVDRFNFYGFDR